jgi:sec-independent protein translocase protein TatC
MTTTAEGPAAKGRRKPPRNSEGAMSLFDHLRELQSRLFKAAIAVAIGTAIGWIFYTQLFDLIRAPLDPLLNQLKSDNKNVTLAVTGITDAFTLQLKISLAAGVVLALPVWLFQLWRFIAPGLKNNERKWAYGFVAAATPLFLGGIALGYAIMPKMLNVFLGFTPDKVANIISVDYYLSFVLQILLFFGVGCLIPLVFVMLNFAGIMTGKRFLGWWRGLIIGTFVFAAVATPTGDPVTMSLVALPLLTLVATAAVIMLLNDGRRSRRDRRLGYGQWTDDELSPLDSTADEHLPDEDYTTSTTDFRDDIT